MRSRAPLYVDLASAVYPKDGNGTTLTTGAVDLHNYDSVKFALLFGVLNDSAAITAINVQQSPTTTSGDFVTMGPPWNIAAKTGTDDNTVWAVNVGREDLSDGNRYVRLTLTVDAHAALLAVLALGFLPMPPGDGCLGSCAAFPKGMAQ